MCVRNFKKLLLLNTPFSWGVVGLIDLIHRLKYSLFAVIRLNESRLHYIE